MRPKKRRWLIVLGALGVLLLLFAVSAEITSHSRFCSVCHYMKIFYQSWKTSAHGEVECSVCHYPPGVRGFFRAKTEGLLQLGRYWTKLYRKSKPWAEIPDESCLRTGCHEKRLLEGRVRFKKVVFDHGIHLGDLKRGKTLRCTSCHSQIVQGEHITVTESSCFICHFKASEHYPGIADCSHCHTREELVAEDELRFNHTVVFENNYGCDKCHSQVIIGDGAVPRENCYKCHFESERLDQYENTDLMHSTHITANKIECNQCHLEIQHKIVRDIETIADCRACHTGFHQAQRILYTGEGGKGVDHPLPNVMLEKGLSCKGCHIFHEETGGRLITAQTLVAREKACESCHGRGFARLVENWQLSTSRKLTQVKAVYARARGEVEASRGEAVAKARARELLEEAAFNLDLVDKGKAVHNIAYSQELLLAAFNLVEKALAAAGSSYRPERAMVETASHPGECASCHAGIEEISTRIFGISFPHKTHVVGQKMECGVCHSNTRRHGEFISSKKACAACHHGETGRECGSCHELQKTLYEGGRLEGRDIPKDLMAEAEVGCDGCHERVAGRIGRSGAPACANCHEESYKQTFSDWQKSFSGLVTDLERLIKEKKSLPLDEKERAALAEAEGAARALVLDGSSGVHNSQFSDDLLTKLIAQVKSIQGKKGP